MLYYMNWLTHDFWTWTGGWEFDRSRGAGRSSPSHSQQVEEQALKPVGWTMCFLLMTLVPVQKLCVAISVYIYVYILIQTIISVQAKLEVVSGGNTLSISQVSVPIPLPVVKGQTTVPVWDDILTPTIFWPRGQNIVTIYWPPLRYFDLPNNNQWQSFIFLLYLLDSICHLIRIILMNF